MEEKELLRLLNRDCELGLQAALELYGSTVKTIVNRVLYQFPQDAEECTADVFLKLWKNRRRLKGTPIRAWLIVTARNTAIDRRRKIGRTENLTMIPETQEIISEFPEEKLGSLIDDLPPPDREIFIRKYYFLETSAEIAAATGRSEDDINARLSRRRQKIREEILKGGHRYA